MITPTSGAYGQLLFILPVYAHTPNEYDRQWQKGLKRDEEYFVRGTPEEHASIHAQQIELARDIYENQNPIRPRYHDIVGFVELYLSHNRFEADFYFKPDRRKKFGRGMASKFRLNPKRYYLRSWQSPLANTSHLQTLEEKSAALGEALREAKAAVEKLGCYMDISLETQILRHLDVPKLLGWT